MRKAMMPRNRLRIIGGVWRSRVLDFPSVSGLRPTGDRIRETLFNWLGQTLDGLSALDGFAGSGALGFEAASRGARRVVLCEQDATARRALVDNRARLGAAGCEIAGDVFDFLATHREKFDVAFCDPPFAAGLQRVFLERLAPHLAADARVYVESAGPLSALLAELNPELRYAIFKSAKAGAVHYGLFQIT